MWLSALIVALLLALTLSVVGWRGRRVDDHPWCRKCRYDLFGNASTSTLCPECGADLTRRGAVPIGRRRKRRFVLTLGLLMLGVVAAISGVLLYGRATQLDWNAHKPTWLLILEARHSSPGARSAVLDELLRRQIAGNLSPSQIDVIVAQGLAAQSNVAQAWEVQWGDLIESARLQGRLSDEHWSTYARQAVHAELFYRPVMVEGDSLAAAVRLHCRSAGKSILVATIDQVAARVGELVFLPHFSQWTTQLHCGTPGSGFPTFPAFHDIVFNDRTQWPNHRPDSAKRLSVRLGRHDVRVSVPIHMAEGSYQAGQGFVTGETIHEQTHQRSAQLEVLPAGSETVTLVRDEAMGRSVEESLRVQFIKAQQTPFVWSDDGATVHSSREGASKNALVSGHIVFGSPPTDLAFDVFIRNGNREWPLGQIDSEQEHRWDFTGQFRGQCRGFEAKRVDVVLRTSTAAARQSLRITRIWDGEIVFRDVKVDWSAPVGAR